MLDRYGEVVENASLENYNTYGIKTHAKYLVKPSTLENLKDLISYLNNENIKYYVLGCGSNVILHDNTFNGVVITLENLNNVQIDDTNVIAEAGISLGVFVSLCIKHSLGGLEHLALVPGTLGGALYGNAGVKDSCIYDYVENITILKDNNYITLDKKDVKYSYRNTMFKETKDLIISATFNLYKDDRDKLKEVVKENRIKRLNSQPLEYKNAGSVFKNPEGDYAGRLIESLGLKGYTIGGAQISHKHANFIINIGNATGSDIRNLIKYIKERVYEEYKIELELEQIIIDWE